MQVQKWAFYLYRTFYFVDLVHPTRLEVSFPDNNSVPPTFYDPTLLHDNLCPKIKERSLNKGGYILLKQYEGGEIYWYGFPSTRGASTVGKNLDLSSTFVDPDVKCAADILPPCSSQFTAAFIVPMKFVPEPALNQAISQAVREGFEMALSLSQLTPDVCHRKAVEIASNVHKIPGEEPNRNDCLIDWLKDQLGSDFHILGQKNPSENMMYNKRTYYISQFGRSKEDFGFFNIRQFSRGSGGVSAGLVQPRIVDHLTAGAGDSKDEAAEKDQYQMIANMVKTAADLGFVAANSAVLFETITIYGLLVDYTHRKSLRQYKLVFDFERRSSILHKCDDEAIELTEAFERVTSLLNLAVQ